VSSKSAWAHSKFQARLGYIVRPLVQKKNNWDLPPQPPLLRDSQCTGPLLPKFWHLVPESRARDSSTLAANSSWTPTVRAGCHPRKYMGLGVRQTWVWSQTPLLAKTEGQEWTVPLGKTGANKNSHKSEWLTIFPETPNLKNVFWCVLTNSESLLNPRKAASDKERWLRRGSSGFENYRVLLMRK
jgi:hypothetical protein